MYTILKKREYLPIKEYIFFYGYCDTYLKCMDCIPMPKKLYEWTHVDSVSVLLFYNTNDERLHVPVYFTIGMDNITEIMIKMEEYDPNAYVKQSHVSHREYQCKQGCPWEFCIRILVKEKKD